MGVTEYRITETGPAIGTGKVCYMVGVPAARRYVGDFDTLGEAMEFIATDKDNPHSSFEVDFIPWKK